MKEQTKKEMEERLRTIRRAAKKAAEAESMQEKIEVAKQVGKEIEGYIGDRLTRTKEEILKNGTGEERAALYVVDYERVEQDMEAYLTEGEKKRIYPTSKKEMTAFKDYLYRYDTIKTLENYIAVAYRMYQVEAGNLQRLLIIREGYEKEILGRGFLLAQMERTLKERGGFNEAFIKELIQDVRKSAPLEGEDFQIMGMGFGRKDYTEEEKKVEKQIKEAVHKVEDRIAFFKGYAVAIDEYLKERGLSRNVLPLFTKAAIYEVENEEHYNLLEMPKKYRRSYINRRREAGEEIKPEEEEEAVAPDYNEVEMNFDRYQQMKKALS